MLDNKDGIPWYKAPAPPRRHKHYAWTTGILRGEVVHRCPCGAIGDWRGWCLLDEPRVAPREGILARLIGN